MAPEKDFKDSITTKMKRTLRFIRRFCPGDETLFQNAPNIHMGIKETNTTTATSNGESIRSIEISTGGGNKGILEDCIQEDYIPADGSTASAAARDSSHGNTRTTSTPQSSSKNR